MTDLRNFQIGFGRFLRDPERAPLLGNIPERRAEIYKELLFNNISGFLNTCFPVCKSILDEDSWQQLRRAFFRDWRCKSPIFSRIPAEFVTFLETSPTELKRLPPWLYSLAHYEWIELALDVMPDTSEASPRQPGILKVRDAVFNLSYDWPVHRISKNFQPDDTLQTFLVALRNRNFRTEFIEINAGTSLLIELLKQSPMSRQETVLQIAQLMNRDMDEAFQHQCQRIIDDLIAQEVIDELSDDREVAL